MEPDLYKVVSFLRSIGLSVVIQEGATGFIDGARIQCSTIFADPNQGIDLSASARSGPRPRQRLNQIRRVRLRSVDRHKLRPRRTQLCGEPSEQPPIQAGQFPCRRPCHSPPDPVTVWSMSAPAQRSARRTAPWPAATSLRR
jgi:hypothetical protein